MTCVGGNVDARQVAENTRAVLELAGRDDVEVALGREIPAGAPRSSPRRRRTGRGASATRCCPRPRGQLSDRHAADLIVEEARRRPGEITLVTLGPLTNLAVAVLREPELPRLLRRWVLMGGSYRSPGNTAPTTEWNVSVRPGRGRRPLRSADFGRWRRGAAAPPAARAGPGRHRAGEAARRSTSSRSPGGPAAGPTRPRPDESPETRSVATHPVIRFVADALRFYMEFHCRYDGFYGAFIHDPLAVAAALDPSLVRAEELTVDVELGGHAHDRRDGDRLAPGVGPAANPGRRGRGRRRPLPRARSSSASAGSRPASASGTGQVAARPACRPGWSSAGRRWRRYPGGNGRPASMERRDRPQRGRHRHGPVVAPRSAPRARPRAASRRSSSPTWSALVVGVVLLGDHRAALARPLHRDPGADARGDRDQHRRRRDRRRPAPADLPRLDRHGARRRRRRTVGRGPDRPPREPHLGDPAGPRRGRPDGRLLRPGGRR